MWESKEQTIDLNYNADELWFTGVYGQAVNKPVEIRKWEENTKFFKLLDKSYPRSKADRILQDLSLIALTYSKQAVQQRLTFKPNPKGENSAPVVFQYDKDGDLLTLALELRQVPSLPPEDGPTPKKTPASKAFKTPRGDDEDDLQDEVSSTFEVETRAERNFKQRKKQSNPGTRATPRSQIVTNTRSNYIANSPMMSSFTSKSCSASMMKHDAISCNGSLGKKPRNSSIVLVFLPYSKARNLPGFTSGSKSSPASLTLPSLRVFSRSLAQREKQDQPPNYGSPKS